MKELISFPNLYEWNDKEYLEWGVRVMLSNDGLEVSKHVINILSSRRRGPSFHKFECALENYRRFRKKSRRYIRHLPPVLPEETKAYKRLSTHVELLSDYFGERASDSVQERLTLAVQFEIARHLIKGLRNSEVAEIVYGTDPTVFVDRLIEENCHLNPVGIKQMARKLGLHDILWPPISTHQEYLRVTPEELDAGREENAKYQKLLKRRQRLQKSKNRQSGTGS